MRICLFCNERAGEGVSAASLADLIARAGHQVERVVDDLEQLRPQLDSTLECVAVAGGDGTVAKVGGALAGGNIPMAILPLGTANNIAGSLAIKGTPAQLIEKWRASRIVRIDVGVIHDATGTHYFLESVGTGLVVAGITLGRAEIHRGAAPHGHLEHARRLYVEQASRLQPEPCVVTIEGHEMQDTYLAVEILNTPAVGPGIRLSADVNAADGFLSVVVAGEAERAALVSYLQAPAGPNHAGLKAIRAERVELSGARQIHVDDEVRDVAGERIAISIKPGWLPVLA